MSTAESQVYSAPFDAVADCYDSTFTESRIGRAQRAAVWSELARAFNCGDRVLEIGCGTGVDACYLAGRGVRVVASDPSNEMIRVATDRIQQCGLQRFVRPLVLRAEDISTLHGEIFDGAFSNFGPLNCVEDLAQFARDLACLLKPGGTALLCWMNSCCLWEMAWYLTHGNCGKAFRRLQRRPVTARIADGVSVPVRYPSVKSVARIFAPAFRIQAIKGVGFAVPPSYLEPWAVRHPRLMQMCELADSWAAECRGLRLLADHVLVRLERAVASLETPRP